MAGGRLSYLVGSSFPASWTDVRALATSVGQPAAARFQFLPESASSFFSPEFLIPSSSMLRPAAISSLLAESLSDGQEALLLVQADGARLASAGDLRHASLLSALSAQCLSSSTSGSQREDSSESPENNDNKNAGRDDGSSSQGSTFTLNICTDSGLVTIASICGGQFGLVSLGDSTTLQRAPSVTRKIQELAAFIEDALKEVTAE